jgi:hypothetical protein
VVVETYPVSGARDVEPGETEIRIRFSRSMTGGSGTWSIPLQNSASGSTSELHYDDDGRTCVIKTKLEPGKTYSFWLNRDDSFNFKDANGQPAVPYLLIFQTKQK